jgi:hypothetical protein
MSSGVFEIEWDDDLGEHWMNVDNLLRCLAEKCPNTSFTVRQIDSRGVPRVATTTAGQCRHVVRSHTPERELCLDCGEILARVAEGV